MYFGVSTTMYGVTLWLPSVIQSLSGLGNFATRLVAVLPFVVTAVAMVLVGMHRTELGSGAGTRRFRLLLERPG